MRILVVNPTHTTRCVILDCLTKMELANVAETDNSAEALKFLEANEPYDLIITDWVLNDLSGIPLLKAIRAKTQPSYIPVLMVVDKLDKGDIIEAIKEGAAEFVIKPFQPETLQDKIRSCLKKSKQQTVAPAAGRKMRSLIL